MTSTNFLRAALLTSIFAASTLALPANASLIKRDEYGFEARKICLSDKIIRGNHVNETKAELIGKAQSAEWDMELYANKETGRWSLLGKRRDPAANPEKTCVLSTSEIYPYQEEIWYALFFKQNVKPTEQMAQKPARKLNLN